MKGGSLTVLSRTIGEGLKIGVKESLLVDSSFFEGGLVLTTFSIGELDEWLIERGEDDDDLDEGEGGLVEDDDNPDEGEKLVDNSEELLEDPAPPLRRCLTRGGFEMGVE